MSLGLGILAVPISACYIRTLDRTFIPEAKVIARKTLCQLDSTAAIARVRCQELEDNANAVEQHTFRAVRQGSQLGLQRLHLVRDARAQLLKLLEACEFCLLLFDTRQKSGGGACIALAGGDGGLSPVGDQRACRVRHVGWLKDARDANTVVRRGIYKVSACSGVGGVGGGGGGRGVVVP